MPGTYAITPSTITVEAGADLSAKQFFFHTIAADGQIDPTGAGLAADGVLQNDPDAAGQAAALATHPGDVSKVVAGAAITKGDLLETDSSGRAITRTTGVIVGRALLAATAAGDIIPALLALER